MMTEDAATPALAGGSDSAAPADLAAARAVPPVTSDALLARLADLGIAAPTVEHPPVFTVAEAQEHRAGIEDGGHSKNLFLKDKKGALFLVVCHEETPVDLKALHPVLGSGRLSFCSAERLMEYLGVIPGSVTPFALINDTALAVQPVFERRLLEMEPLHFHPLTNTRTTSVSREGLLRFVEACGHKPMVVDLPERPADAGEGA
ncbi:prolyl-tRNA synthetase associated domain-containing protein [Radicibacter daui]|uniref:prolyl-tRNA synthetase associated domain-containing protein n=1 Tax=Radicibacter daui TaxID=3064829 RepID=UPI0040468ED3